MAEGQRVAEGHIFLVQPIIEVDGEESRGDFERFDTFGEAKRFAQFAASPGLGVILFTATLDARLDVTDMTEIARLSAPQEA